MKRELRVIFNAGLCLACMIMIFVFGSGLAFSQEGKFTPTSDYRKESIQGFTILVNKETLKHPREYQELHTELTSQLTAIAHVVPSKPLVALRNLIIWVEWENRKDGAAEFHPSKQWLMEHDYNPEKAGAVEISNTRNFVQWSKSSQPWMLMHELAHSYHFLILKEDNPAIQAAYENALNKLLYTSVSYINGGNQRAYALTNNKEYFAEITEAYFGKNDFYPFTKTDLEKYDPIGYRLMKEVWGD